MSQIADPMPSGDKSCVPRCPTCKHTFEGDRLHLEFVDKLNFDHCYINLDNPYGHGHRVVVALIAMHGITQGHSGVIGIGVSLPETRLHLSLHFHMDKGFTFRSCCL